MLGLQSKLTGGDVWNRLMSATRDLGKLPQSGNCIELPELSLVQMAEVTCIGHADHVGAQIRGEDTLWVREQPPHPSPPAADGSSGRSTRQRPGDASGPPARKDPNIDRATPDKL